MGTTLTVHCDQFTDYKCLLEDVQLIENITDIAINAIHLIIDSAHYGDDSVVNFVVKNSMIHSIPMVIFTKFENLMIFSLRHVNLKRLETFSNCKQLEEIDLAYNDLETIPSVFDSCEKLISIFLESNSITTVDSGAFSKLKNLQELYLQINNIVDLPATLLQSSARIKTVSLRDNEIRELPQGFLTNLTSLRFLFLSRNPFKSPHDISNTFKGLKNLITLWLSATNIRVISQDSFKGLTSLNVLELDNNQIEFLPTNVFYELKQLEELGLSGNQIFSIDSSCFAELPKLLKLELHNNSITQFDFGTFAGLNLLTSLTINDNQVRFLRSNAFGALEKLKMLDIRNMSLAAISPKIFNQTQNSNLRVVKAEGNICVDENFENFDKSVLNNCFSKVLTCSFTENDHGFGCEISSVNITMGSIFMSEFDAPERSVENVYFTDSRLDFVPDEIFTEFPSITRLDLSSVGLRELHQIFMNCTSLTHLILNQNELKDLPGKVFSNCLNLEHVEIFDNAVGAIDKNAFQGLTSLKTLSIQNSEAKTISKETVELDSELFQQAPQLESLLISLRQPININKPLQSLKELKILRVEDNLIPHLGGDFLTNSLLIEQLSLSRNQISSIDERFFGPIMLTSQIDLSHNNLSSFPPTLFNGRLYCTHLNLSNNVFSSLPTSLNNLEGLKQLSMENNLLTELGTELNLASLKNLTLNGNKIKAIRPGFFEFLPNLTSLRMKGSDCVETDADGLVNLTDPQALSTCYQNYIDEAFCVFQVNKFHGYSCQVADTVTGDSARMHLVGRTDDDVEYLYLKKQILTTSLNVILQKFKSLKNIDFWKTGISSLEPLTNCSKIESIDLRFNNITELQTNVFKMCANMETLILVKNEIQAVDIGAFKGLRELKHLDLSYNEIRCLDNEAFKELENLKRLNLEGNSILGTETVFMVPLRAIEVLNLSYNQMTVFSMQALQFNSNLREIYLNGNQMKKLYGSWYGSDYPALPRLQYLSVEDNSLSVFNLESVSLSSLQYLDISGNNISYIKMNTTNLCRLTDFYASDNNCVKKMESDEGFRSEYIETCLECKEESLQQDLSPEMQAMLVAVESLAKSLYFSSAAAAAVTVTGMTPLQC